LIRYHECHINEMPACQLFWSRTITYRLITPSMPFFCMAETTPALNRWDDRGAWMMWV
jgi:hypothetical protein